MNTTRLEKNGRAAQVAFPTRADVEGLKVGDLAPNCFGELAQVVEIFGRGEDLAGRAFACVYLQHGENATISESYKEGELQRTVRATVLFTSAELDNIERRMRATVAA